MRSTSGAVEREVSDRDPQAIPAFAGTDGAQSIHEASRDRHADAIEHLVREIGPRMSGLARRILVDPEAARDAVREAFVIGLRSFHGFRGGELIVDRLRRLVVESAVSRLPREDLEVELGPTAEESDTLYDPAFPSESNGSAAEIGRYVRSCIGRLPALQRAILILRDGEAFDADEVARFLGMSRETVHVHLHRARQQLMRRLQDRPPLED